MKRIQLENQVFEMILCDELDKNSIKYRVRSYYDLALDGLYQTQKGYGYIEIEDADEERVNEIYKRIKAGE